MDRNLAIEDTIVPPEIVDRFPFQVIVQGDYHEFDLAERWCWLSFGPRDGKCNLHTHYPACPVILAIEKVPTTVVRFGLEHTFMERPNLVEHVHTGTWTTNSFGKTDYDYGFAALYFANEDDKSRFLEQVPQIDPAKEPS